MIEIDTKEIKKFVKNLKKTSAYAYPKAVRSTMDKAAYNTCNKYKTAIKKEFTIRNAQSNIIIKSIAYEKCSNSLNISDMQSIAGQKCYIFGKETTQLRKQEFGENITAKHKHLFKPTKFARGGNYKRAVKPSLYLAQTEVKTIDKLVKFPSKNVKKQFSQAAAVANNTKQDIYFLGGNKDSLGFAIIKNKNVKRPHKNKQGKITGGTVRNSIHYMYSLKGKTQKLTAHHILEKTSQETVKDINKIFINEANRRIAKEMAKGLKT